MPRFSGLTRTPLDLNAALVHHLFVNIDQYLRKTQTSDRALGKILNVHGTTVGRWRTGATKPPGDKWEQLVAWSKGQITAAAQFGSARPRAEALAPARRRKSA